MYITLFYEHFLERDTEDIISPRVWYAVVPILLMLVYGATELAPRILAVPYAFAVLVLFTLPPCAVLFYRRPNLYKKILLPALFFIPLHLMHEVAGLQLGQWYFPGEYAWQVPFWAGTAVPIEEFVFWILLGSIIVVAYYQL